MNAVVGSTPIPTPPLINDGMAMKVLDSANALILDVILVCAVAI